jgi:alpha-N-arabinofuranosidase
VRIACLAQLVNVIAPIRTEPDARAWRQTIYYPFALTARYARGDVLRVEPRSPVLHSPTLGDVPTVDVVVTRDPATGEMAVFALNRDDTAPVLLELRLTDQTVTRVVEHLVIGGGDLGATNTRELPDAVVPRHGTGTQVTGRTLSIPLQPASWTLIRTEPVAT